MLDSFYKIGDKVFVSDWGKLFTNIYRWVKGKRELVFSWNTIIPDYTSTDFHWKFIREPKLTLKGKPFKDGSTVVKESIPLYKDYEYTVLEKTERGDGKVIYLLSSNHTEIESLKCYVQILEGGITQLTPQEQKQVKEEKIGVQKLALRKNHLGRWRKEDDVREFPEELLEVLYDEDQRVCFGSDFPNTKGIVKYFYIPKEYCFEEKPIYSHSLVIYNGVGCNLTDKNTITWRDLQKMFK